MSTTSVLAQQSDSSNDGVQRDRIQSVAATNSELLFPLRCVSAGILVGLLWKIAFLRGADQIYLSVHLQDGFFPALLQQAWTLRLAYLIAIAAILMVMVAQEKSTRRAAISISWLASTVMLLHQGSYNDMTFTTVWWCNVWALWFVWRIDVDQPDRLRQKAAFLSRLMLSVVLIGGAMGKWTGEYWSGEVFYEIYFRDRDFWVFNLLRSWADNESLQWVAMAYSRWVIAVETVGGLCLWLMPPRWAAVTGVVIFASIALLSNFLLVSVLGPLIALSIAGWYAPKVLTKH